MRELIYLNRFAIYGEGFWVFFPFAFCVVSREEGRGATMMDVTTSDGVGVFRPTEAWKCRMNLVWG